MAVVGMFALKAAVSYVISNVVREMTTKQKPEKEKTIQKLEGLTVQTCGWGGVIPISWGANRLAGNVIWSEAVNDDAGANPPTRVVSFAVGICRGPMTGLSKIWVDGDLVYDSVLPLPAASAGSTLEQLRAALKFSYHPGDETQEVDPVCESGFPVILDVFVDSITRTDPPVGPPWTETFNAGMWYVPAGATGVWAGHTGTLAIYLSSPEYGVDGWQFMAIPAEMTVYCFDDATVYQWISGAWVVVGSWVPSLTPGSSGPAYRGLCYCVFEDFPLHYTGGRVPLIEFEIRNEVSASPYTEIPEQTIVDIYTPPPAEQVAWTGSVVNMTGFDHGVDEFNPAYVVGNVSFGSGYLDIEPDGASSTVDLQSRGSGYIGGPGAPSNIAYGNLRLTVLTRPSSGEQTLAKISTGASAAGTELRLSSDGYLSLYDYAGVRHAVCTTPLSSDIWYNVTFGICNSILTVDGVQASQDSVHVTTSSASRLIMGSYAADADYHVQIGSVAGTTTPLPGSWGIDSLDVGKVIGDMTGIATSGSGTYPSSAFFTDAEPLDDDDGEISAYVNRRGGYPGTNPPASPNYLPVNSLRKHVVSADTFTLVPVKEWSAVHQDTVFYSMLAVFDHRGTSVNVFFSMSMAVGSESSEIGPIGPRDVGYFRAYHGICLNSGSSWYAPDIDGTVITYEQPMADAYDLHLYAIGVYALHSNVLGTMTTETLPPGTAVNASVSGVRDAAPGGGGANIVASAAENIVFFMEWGHWYAYMAVHKTVPYEAVYTDIDGIPTMPPVGCDFDADEDHIIYTAKVSDDSDPWRTEYESYGDTVLASGDSVETEWPLTIDTFVDGVTVQSSVFTIPSLSGNYLDLDLVVKVNNVTCDETHNPYTYNHATNTIVFDDPPADDLQVKAAWGFNREIPSPSIIVRLDYTTSSPCFGEIVNSAWALWEVQKPVRFRVRRATAGPVFVMCATNSDSSPGSIIKIRRRTTFLWDYAPETTISPKAGTLFRCMTVDNVSGFFFAVSSDLAGETELVIAQMDAGELADPIRFDISDYIDDPDAIMVWSAVGSTGVADRIAIGQKNGTEKISFWSLTTDSDTCTILYEGELTGDVVPSQATSAWRRGAVGMRPKLVFAYDHLSPTVIKRLDLTSRTLETTWYVLANESDGDLLPGFHGGSVYLSSFGKVVSGCLPAVAEDVYSYVSVDLLNPETVPAIVGSVVSDICLEAGLSAGQVDSNSLGSVCRGYTVATRQEARAALTPLLDAFNCSAVESEGKIKFVRRSGVSATTINAGDLAAHQEGSERPQTLSTTMGLSSSIPTSVELSFINSDAAYMQGVARVSRTVGDPGNKMALSSPIVMTRAEAAGVARRALLAAWVERTTFTWAMGRAGLIHEPCDVVTVPLGGGMTAVARIESMTPSGGVTTIEAAADSLITWE